MMRPSAPSWLPRYSSMPKLLRSGMNLSNVCQLRIHHGAAIAHASSNDVAIAIIEIVLRAFSTWYPNVIGNRLTSDPLVKKMTPHRPPYMIQSRIDGVAASRKVSSTTSASSNVERLVSHTQREAHATSNGSTAKIHPAMRPAVSCKMARPMALMTTHVAAAKIALVASTATPAAPLYTPNNLKAAATISG